MLADAAVAEFEARHGKVPGSELLILGLGRLGGEALTHASDLDLVYLFSGSHEAESDGPRPLRATDYFNRLAPRVTRRAQRADRGRPALRRRHAAAALRHRRPARDQPGKLRRLSERARLDLRAYGADPGAAGLRLGGGPRGAGSDRPRRARAGRATRPSSSPTRSGCAATCAPTSRPSGPFDIKRGEGGLIDLEFAVHLLQLRHGIGLHPHLEDALAAFSAAGLVAAGDRSGAAAADPHARHAAAGLAEFGARRPSRAGRSSRAPAAGRLGRTACGARAGAAEHKHRCGATVIAN